MLRKMCKFKRNLEQWRLWEVELGWEEGSYFLTYWDFLFYLVYVFSTFIIKGVLKNSFLA